MLGGEFRYLTRQDKGTITAEVIPSDALYEDGGTRGAFNFDQQGLFFKRLSTYIDYSAVSDDQYLEDLGNNIDATSTRRLTQRGDLTYLGKGWSLLTACRRSKTWTKSATQALGPISECRSCC
jgi:LPS-assembly protein